MTGMTSSYESFLWTCSEMNFVLLILFLSSSLRDVSGCEDFNLSAGIYGVNSKEFSMGFNLFNVTFRNTFLQTTTYYVFQWDLSEIDDEKPNILVIFYEDDGQKCSFDNITGYNVKCSSEELFSEVQVAKNLTLKQHKEGACITVVNTADRKTVGSLSLVFKECNSDSPITNQKGQNISITTDNSSVMYNDKGTCSCFGINGTLRYDTGEEHPGIVICNETAKWNGCDNAECWFDPSEVIVYQGSEFENTPAQFSCTFEPGYPIFTNVYYSLNGMSVDQNKSLVADDYKKLLQCTVNNSMFAEVKSSELTVNVFFSPQDLSPTDLRINLAKNESQDVHFKFRAHANGSMFAEFFKTPNNGSKELLPLSNSTENDVYFTFNSIIEIVSDEDYGIYTFFVNTSSPDGNVSAFIEVVENSFSTQSITTTIGSDLPVPAIAASCAILVLIIILLVVFLIYRRRKNKKTKAGESGVKEEKDNPLYGTSTAAGSATEYSMVNRAGNASSSKEERLNPLYDSNTGAQGGVEEAYAAVDVRKKRKKNKADKGNENAAFSAESNAAVYAAVDKSKKKKNDKPPVEAVYSEVNKKKGSKNDTALHGSSQ